MAYKKPEAADGGKKAGAGKKFKGLSLDVRREVKDIAMMIADSQKTVNDLVLGEMKWEDSVYERVLKKITIRTSSTKNKQHY